MSLSTLRGVISRGAQYSSALGPKLLCKSNVQPAFIKLHFRQTKVCPPQLDPSKSNSVWDKLFGKYLLATNILSSGILMVAGDIVLQEVQYRQGNLPKRYDWMRVGRMFVVGTLQGPLHHYFYRWLDRIIVGVTLKTTTWKILCDQFIMSPVCIVLFFYPASLLENKSFQDATSEIKSKFLTVYTADWCVWPAAQFFNFYYLEPKYRVLYINVVTLIYNIFLSYIKHKETT